MEGLNIDITQQEMEKIQRVLDALRMKGEQRTVATMDLTVAHKNGCALDLDNMVAFAESGSPLDQFHVIHDIIGISENLDRETGRLERFRPRFAVEQ